MHVSPWYVRMILGQVVDFLQVLWFVPPQPPLGVVACDSLVLSELCSIITEGIPSEGDTSVLLFQLGM